ncbi:MAG: murein biosynthesis integral membrane protein MurJ [Treponema sp.]|nr:murein biosynthesis integral membrane protein MurJ [Treponema sp.]
MVSMKNNSLIKKGLSLSVLTLFSRILGLVREMTKAKFLGTTAYSDAFNVAFMIPNLFRRLFAENAISVAFIPTFKGYIEDSDTPEKKQDAQNFVNATFTLISFMTTLFVTIGIIFTPLILKIFFDTEKINALDEGIILTRIMFPYLIVISIAALFQGILNSLKIFSPSGFTPILFNGIVIGFTYIFKDRMANPARAMATGVICGGLVQAFFQLPFVLKNDWKITFTSLKNAFTNPGTKKIMLLVAPTIIGMAGYQLNDVVSTALATHAGEGVASSLQYSLRLQELILGICAVTIGTVILPDLAGFSKNNEWEKFNELLSQSIKIMIFISIPITFYSLSMNENIISLVFASGKFNADSISMTKEVFKFHIAGLCFIALNRIIAPSFYAQQNTKSPTIAGLVNFAANMILASILVRKFGGNGIALALTLASAVNTIMLFIFLGKSKNIQLASLIKNTLLYTIKMCLFSAIAAVPVYLLRGKIISLLAGHDKIISQGIPVGTTALLFGAIGIGLMIVTKDPLIKSVLNKIKSR